MNKYNDERKSAETLLLRLIRQRAWKKIRKILSFNPKLAKSRASPCCAHCTQLHSPLLLACELSPPLDIVESLLQFNSAAAFEADCEKKLPLHVACEYGASPVVIQKLLEANTGATMKKDIYGMLPIHKVCQSYLYNFDPYSSEKDPQYSLIETITILLNIQPIALLVDDHKEMNPIEYALESNLSLAVIIILQKVSEREHLKKNLHKTGYFSRAA